MRATFLFSVKRNKEGIIYTLSGRCFTLYDLKKATIKASGGYVVGLAVHWHQWLLWEVIEAIELTAEIEEESRNIQG